MDSLHAELWRKICAFELDKPGDELTFSARLARENDWGIGYAHRVVDEYRRFLFLAMVAEHEVTPSHDVDEVWHLHLTYTQNYWDGLCRTVLRRLCITFLHAVVRKSGHGMIISICKRFRVT